MTNTHDEAKHIATNIKHQDDARHMEVIPRKHRTLFCNNRGSGRYTGNWVTGWPAKANMSMFTKTQAERDKLKSMR